MPRGIGTAEPSLRFRGPVNRCRQARQSEIYAPDVGSGVWPGVVAAALMVSACGEADDGAAGDVDLATTTTRVDSDGLVGDPAVWMTSTQLAGFGLPPTSDSEPMSGASSSFTAYVMRLGCNGGETGTVLPPDVAWSDDQITVTFGVDALPPEGTYECPGNDVVPYEVELGQPIGERQLVDGGCASKVAAGTLFCRDEGVRWPPDSDVATSVVPIVTTSTIPPSVPISVEVVPPTFDSSDLPSISVPITLDLSGVTPASVPMAISEHLSTVQLAVRSEVGDDVFAGSAFDDLANDTMTIFGTDAAAITAALDHTGTPLRDRISVVETLYSVNELENYAEQAQSRLDAAGIKGSAWTQFGLDAVAVQLETPDGQPDETIQADATALLHDIPVAITFIGPSLPL